MNKDQVLKIIGIIIFSLFVISIPFIIFTINNYKPVKKDEIFIDYKDECDSLKKEIESLNGYIDLLEEENSIMGSLLGEKEK